LQRERRTLEADFRTAYEALDEHFMLYGDVDGPEPVGLLPSSDAGFSLPDEFPDDGPDADHDFTEEDLVS